MAEPILTSSDIIRERMGFGVSPMASEETRRAYAAAGLSPLSTQARQRFEEGRGLSPMASQQEQEAWRAQKASAGIGERPTLPKTGFYSDGSMSPYARRKLRMQEEWDKQYEMMLKQQEAARQAELQNRELELRQRNMTLQERQEARLQAAEAKLQNEALKISDDADRALNEVLGGFDEAGQQIIGLDPDSTDYMQRRNEIIKRYPKALNDEAFKTAIATTDKSYFDTLNFNQQLQVQQRTEERMLGKEERMEERQRQARQEEAAATASAAEEKDIVSRERDIDKDIRAQRQILAGLQGQKPTKTLEKAATEARNKLLDLRIEKADLRGLVFETQEEADAANPPKGSTIYIGKKPFKVD